MPEPVISNIIFANILCRLSLDSVINSITDEAVMSFPFGPLQCKRILCLSLVRPLIPSTNIQECCAGFVGNSPLQVPLKLRESKTLIILNICFSGLYSTSSQNIAYCKTALLMLSRHYKLYQMKKVRLLPGMEYRTWRR